jgi:hypothetical protein
MKHRQENADERLTENGLRDTWGKDKYCMFSAIHGI